MPPGEDHAATTVRTARPDEAATIARLLNALNAHVGDATGKLTADVVERDSFGPAAAFRTFIALDRDGEAVGVAVVEPTYELAEAARGGYVSALYVVPGLRGRGIGRALMEAVAADVTADGGTFVWLVSQSANDRARRFYPAIGASDVPIHAHALTFDAFARTAERGARRLWGEQS